MVITGSRNPPNHNGCKLKTVPFYGQVIQNLAQRVPIKLSGGSFEDQDVQSSYLDRIAKDFNFPKAIWASGNGASGYVVDALVKRPPSEYRTLFAEING